MFINHTVLFFLLCFVFTLLKGILWTWVIPPFMAPDESAHFAYTQYLVEERRIPKNTREFSVLHHAQSDELAQALALTENEQILLTTTHLNFAHTSKMLPSDLPSADRRVAALLYTNPAALYSPFYYTIEALPYLAGYNLDLFSRLYLMRFFSLIFLLVTTVFAYKIAYLVTKEKNFSLLTAAIINLMPSVNATSFGGVNNDALLIALGHALFFYLLKLLFQDIPLARKSIFSFGVLLGLTLLTKTQAIIFLPLTFCAFLYHGIRHRTVQHSLIILTCIYGIASLIALPFVLPPLAQYMSTASAHTALSAGAVFAPAYAWKAAFFMDITRRMALLFNFWTAVEFFDTLYPLWIMAALWLLCAIALWGLGMRAFVKLNERENAQRLHYKLIACAIAVVLLELFYTLLYYRSALFASSYDFPGQGRYYFVLLAPLIVLFLYGLKYWAQTLFKIPPKIVYALMLFFFLFLHNYALITIALHYNYT